MGCPSVRVPGGLALRHVVQTVAPVAPGGVSSGAAVDDVVAPDPVSAVQGMSTQSQVASLSLQASKRTCPVAGAVHL
jgi:hypothetical protein